MRDNVYDTLSGMCATMKYSVELIEDTIKNMHIDNSAINRVLDISINNIKNNLKDLQLIALGAQLNK